MPRVYCAVYGCFNSSITNPELSYFRLPADAERRSKWLHLISREDLTNKPPQCYTVCEAHFDDMDILAGTHRKKLKNNSLPSLCLPIIQKKDVQTETEAPKLVEKCIQTEDTPRLVSFSTQTAKYLLTGTPRKRKLKSDLLETEKLKSDLLEARKKIKLYEIDNKTEIYQRYNFHKSCDRFLTKNLAELVKAQTRFKGHGQPLNKRRNSY